MLCVAAYAYVYACETMNLARTQAHGVAARCTQPTTNDRRTSQHSSSAQKHVRDIFLISPTVLVFLPPLVLLRTSCRDVLQMARIMWESDKGLKHQMRLHPHLQGPARKGNTRIR
ncbi:hypothetical protein FALCPG4_001260 [Fusarium falciforme]